MLASFFISQGVRVVTNPSSDRAQGEMMRDRIAPLLSKVAPDPVAELLPDDAATWSRIRGVAQVLAGVGLSTGLGRRGSALVLAACNVQDLLAARGSEHKSTKGGELLTRVALTGGLLLAAQDTEGRPSLGYRAHTASLRAKKKAKKGVRGIEAAQADAHRATEKAARRTRKQVRAAGQKAQRALAV